MTLTLTHGMADIEPGLRLHYVTAGDGSRTIVLLHGFPQTWWEWHAVIDPLVAGGFRVVAPDYRGAGQSWRPPGGYDKRTMAHDLQRLLREHLGVDGPVVVAGHDIGLMIAAAYALNYRDESSASVLINREGTPPSSSSPSTTSGYSSRLSSRVGSPTARSRLSSCSARTRSRRTLPTY